jgi:hypothetical protein
MKCATAYQRGNIFYFHACSKSIEGVWIADEPFLMSEIFDDSCGEHVLAALEGSNEGVEHPCNWGQVLKPLLELSHSKSWPEFMKNTKCCHIEQDDSCMVFEPQRNLGPKRGFEPLPEARSEIPLGSSAYRIARALNESLGA